jgi:hypothetical protein
MVSKSKSQGAAAKIIHQLEEKEVFSQKE